MWRQGRGLIAVAAGPPTPRDYLGLHTVHATCNACGRWAKLDLQTMIDRGQGDTPLIKLPPRCQICQHVGHSLTVSGRSYGVCERPAT